MKKSIYNNFKKLKKENFILASNSPRRKKILKDLSLNFISETSNVNEEKLVRYIKKEYKTFNAERMAKLLSLAKTVTTLRKTKKKGYVIGFDTIVVYKKEIINKPKDNKDAIKKLLKLNNKTHKVITGISILHTDDFKNIEKIFKLKKDFNTALFYVFNSKISTCSYDSTKVTFKNVSKKEIVSYVNSKEPFGKAGAYAIQGKGNKLVRTIEGDLYTVIGLPINKFYLMFAKLKTRKSA